MLEMSRKRQGLIMLCVICSLLFAYPYSNVSASEVIQCWRNSTLSLPEKQKHRVKSLAESK